MWKLSPVLHGFDGLRKRIEIFVGDLLLITPKVSPCWKYPTNNKIISLSQYHTSVSHWSVSLRYVSWFGWNAAGLWPMFLISDDNVFSIYFLGFISVFPLCLVPLLYRVWNIYICIAEKNFSVKLLSQKYFMNFQLRNFSVHLCSGCICVRHRMFMANIIFNLFASTNKCYTHL